MSDTVVFVVGARPNFMKSAPVLRALERLAPELDLLLVHTGQHYDSGMSDVFFTELGMPEPDLFLGVGSGSHGEQTAKALVGIEGVLVERSPALAVVAGDVNSTLSGALAAVKLQIPVAHIESGLRSFDETMPEEHNRRLTDHVSSVLLAHSQVALDNLAREGVPADRVHLVGNTMIDTLLEHVGPARAGEPWLRFGLQPGQYGLVTLHRPALVDDPALLRRTAAGLQELAETVPLVFPVHPRTKAQLVAVGLEPELTAAGVVLAEPLGYLDFLGLQAGARLVLTDSGGVQEETSALGVACFTLRSSTERPVTIDLGTDTLLGAEPDRIREIPELLQRPARNSEIPLWDGHAGERAAQVLADFLRDRR
jgi:UDP-N-acetylglucosamine 2-epimerase (non-hydrolysing)